MALSTLLAAQSSFFTSFWFWGILGAVLLVVLFIVAQFFGLWLQAYMSNAGVTFADLVGMKLRKVDSRMIVITKIQLVKAGIQGVTANDLESHYLAGGRVVNVARAMIAANRAAIDLDWKKGCAIDLAGRDILDAVGTSVNPKVIDCPNPERGKTTIDAVAKDGIQLKAKARVTVRTNIGQLIGGATEETVIARVGEAIVSAIGSATSHKEVLADPDRITTAVLAKGLDSGTAFEILSIDIADIDVGSNIGAKLQADQADADKRRYQAEAEKRRAMAIAAAEENRAKIENNRALVVLAEAEVPKAMAQAGRLGLPYLASPIESWSRLEENHARHREACDAAGKPVPDVVPIMRTIFVHENPATLDRARQALEAQAAAMARSGRSIPRDGAVALEDWALVGEPKQVADDIARYRERFGMTHLIARSPIPGVEPAELEASLELMSGLAS
ncbi:MAG: flotillin-like protein FloA [Planctomycetes bacterium]|nr:flotillin-like protein FloA [Planctomycetota bacterium]